MRKKILMLALILGVLILFANSVSAANNTTVKNSKVSSDHINAKYISAVVQEDADISGNVVVYRKTRYNNTPYWALEDLYSSQIYWKNIVTGQTGKVTNSKALQWQPKISGNNVVWTEGDYLSSMSLYEKNILTGSGGRISSSKDIGGLSISGDTVVWQQLTGTKDYVYYKNLKTGSTGRLTNSNLEQLNPVISGNRVIWQEYTTSNSYLYLKDISTGKITKLFTGSIRSYDISGNRLIWENGDNNYIYWKNILTGASGKIIRSEIRDRPKISGNRVVWDEYNGSILAVYEKNIDTGSVVKVCWQTGDSQLGYVPKISGVTVVWQDWKVYPFLTYWKNILTGATGGISSTDTTAPTASASPNAGIYPTTIKVNLKMSEPGRIYYTLNGNTPTLGSTRYTEPFYISTTKTLKFLAVDLAGNLSPIYTKIYTINDHTPPVIYSTIPSNLQTGVSRSSTIAVKFSEYIKYSFNFNNIRIKNLANGNYLTLARSITDNKLYIKTSTRNSNTWYQVTIPAGALKDYAGNNLIANYTFKFKTGT
jgi:beta propeller repeat protein